MDPHPSTSPEGDETCPSCGSSDTFLEKPPSFVQTAKHWFAFGGRLPRNWHCRSCGIIFSGFIELRRRRLIQRRHTSLLHSRSAEPAPRTYFLALFVGIVVGIGFDLTLGWSWWWFPIGALVIAWLIFASSVFWGRHG